MSYVLSASRLMKAKDVLKRGEDLKVNSAIIVAIEANVKHRFSKDKK